MARLVSSWTLVLSLLIILLRTIRIQAKGLGGNNDTAACVQIEREIRALIINRDQAVYGVEGSDISPNDCKVLVDANILGARSDEEQADLCANPCYSTITDKYRVLLDNECFASTDPDKEASGTLLATAYQIGCQTREDGKHCIALLASLVKDAGRRFDLCSEIVEPLGCCFQSYKQYMKIGTSAASKELDEAQETCTKAGVKDLDKVCPCGADNIYNKYAYEGTTICSNARRIRVVVLLVLTQIALILSLR